MSLPSGEYQLSTEGTKLDAELAAYSWGVGAYRFTRYKKPAREAAHPDLRRGRQRPRLVATRTPDRLLR